jgi:hypothetical protein
MDSSRPTEAIHPYLERVDELCALIERRADAVDTGGPANELLRDNIARLAEIGFFGLGVPKHYGGLELPEWVKCESVERIAAACGVTAFSQNQFHGGVGFVGNASDPRLRDELMPKLSAGAILCGVAFAHLRRPTGSPVTAKRADGGYIVRGKAPWISDWSMMHAFVLGAAIEETGQTLFAYVDRAESADRLIASPPMELAVMTASDTVSVEIDDLFVTDAHVLQLCAADHMERSDYRGITGHVTLPLGCARGSVAFLRGLGKPLFAEAADCFSTEVESIRSDSLHWNASRADDPQYRQNALRVRAGAVSVALRAAQTSIAGGGGRSHLLVHPAQRRLREAGFYATMALTADTQAALTEAFTHGC